MLVVNSRLYIKIGIDFQLQIAAPEFVCHTDSPFRETLAVVSVNSVSTSSIDDGRLGNSTTNVTLLLSCLHVEPVNKTL